MINVSTGQTASEEKPVYGRMFQTPFSEQVRIETGVPTLVAGNIFTWDQVNTIVAAGRADLVALARAHLYNPNFTQQAAAHYGWDPVPWPDQYLSAKFAAFRQFERDRQAVEELREAAKPGRARRPAPVPPRRRRRGVGDQGRRRRRGGGEPGRGAGRGVIVLAKRGAGPGVSCRRPGGAPGSRPPGLDR